MKTLGLKLLCGLLLLVGGYLLGWYFSPKDKILEENKKYLLKCEDCTRMLSRPFDVVFSLPGVIKNIKGDNLLISFNNEEAMWISLIEGYEIIDSNKQTIKLNQLRKGMRCEINDIGLSDITENLIYAKKIILF